MAKESRQATWCCSGGGAVGMQGWDTEVGMLEGPVSGNLRLCLSPCRSGNLTSLFQCPFPVLTKGPLSLERVWQKRSSQRNPKDSLLGRERLWACIL